MLRRSTRASLAALLVGVAYSACSGERRDWAFVQSVGGMALGTPYRNASGVMLPVAVDVSGLRAITTTPRIVNSGLALKEIAVWREGRTLGLALITTVAGPGARTTSGDLELGPLEPGRYTVVYPEPDGRRVELGEIAVAP
jgi:hypothetical protein